MAIDSKNFVFGRTGRIASQIGPLVAASEEFAIVLIQKTLTEFPNDSFFLDAFNVSNWNRNLRDLGFNKKREFIRMQRGSKEFLGRYEGQFAITGPELG